MLNKLYPYEYVKSVFHIDYKKLYSMGYRALMFDIDNTLVHHGEDATKDVEELFRYLHEIGFKTLLLSNNDTERIERFITNIDTLYIADAEKPKTHSYIKALEMLGATSKEALVIGDQVFTDIQGANKCGIANILVEFMRYESETKIGKKRTVEKLILKLYSHSKKYRNRIGNIETKERILKNVFEERSTVL